MSQLLSPPASPRDHRHYIPRRPSPLSLPPTAPHIALSGSSSGYQPFALSEFALATPRSGSKVPRYPLEKQRRALKELEMENERKRRSQQMQRQEPMEVPGGGSRAGGSGAQQNETQVVPSPTTTLPLTPRSTASTVSAYSQEEDAKKSRRGGPAVSLCGSIFGSCFAAFAAPTKRLETVNVNMRTIASAR